MTEVSFEDLFALRFHYIDYIDDEKIIITHLKVKLLESEIEHDNINMYLFSFYEYYNIPITMNDIISVDININNNENNNNENNNNENNNNENNNIFINKIINIINVLNDMQDEFHDLPPLINLNNLSDVIVTTDKTDLEQLKEIKYNDVVCDCMICMMEVKKDDIILDIECKHIFHKDCLFEYLNTYNHICPICRKDIGKTNI